MPGFGFKYFKANRVSRVDLFMVALLMATFDDELIFGENQLLTVSLVKLEGVNEYPN